MTEEAERIINLPEMSFCYPTGWRVTSM